MKIQNISFEKLYNLYLKCIKIAEMADNFDASTIWKHHHTLFPIRPLLFKTYFQNLSTLSYELKLWASICACKIVEACTFHFLFDLPVMKIRSLKNK